MTPHTNPYRYGCGMAPVWATVWLKTSPIVAHTENPPPLSNPPTHTKNLEFVIWPAARLGAGLLGCSASAKPPAHASRRASAWSSVIPARARDLPSLSIRRPFASVASFCAVRRSTDQHLSPVRGLGSNPPRTLMPPYRAGNHTRPRFSGERRSP